jgi:hypothetical protein
MAKKAVILEDDATPESVENVINEAPVERVVEPGLQTRGYRTAPLVYPTPAPVVESEDGEQE